MDNTKVNTAVKTFLPIFSGFYATIWESVIDNNIEYEIEYYKEETSNDTLTDMDFDIDYKAMFNDLSEQIFDIITSDMEKNNLISGAKFEKLVSPKYYNYNNDSINIEVYLNEDNIDTIETILNENKDSWAEYVKSHFTSYDGFSSYYSNNINNEDWNLREIIENGYTQLGFILEFILTDVYGINEETIYYDIEFYASEYMELKKNEVANEVA